MNELGGLVSETEGLVLFLISLVHVSIGTAQWQRLSTPKLLVPLTIWKKPFSPQ